MGLFRNPFKKPELGVKIRTCALCGRGINPEHKKTKQQGLYYHRECWNSAKSKGF